MVEISHILGPYWDKDLNAKANTTPARQQIIEAMALHGLLVPDEIHIDSDVHRFKATDGDKKRSGWYIFHSGVFIAGAFGDWRTNSQVTFRQDIGRDLTVGELQHHEESLRLTAERKKILNEQAIEHCKQLWHSCEYSEEDHTYLQRKKIKTHQLKVTSTGSLLVPVLDANNYLLSLQFIRPNGSKKFQKGASVKGGFYTLGVERFNGDDEKQEYVYICEGFATAATIFEHTDALTYMAFSASNLLNVAEIVKARHPLMKVILVADNDESGTGKKYADIAAEAIGAEVVMPRILGDVNDFFLKNGNVEHLLIPNSDQFCLWIDEFCEKPAPIQWHVKNWWQKESLIMVHGKSGSGKTFYVLDCALRIASAKDGEDAEWFGHKVKPGCVLYLAGEGHAGLKARARAWIQEHKAVKPKLLVSRHGVDLNKPKGLDLVKKAVKSMNANPSLIVVDTLHRFLDGDENSSQDAKTMLDACAKLTTYYKASVLLVHHTGNSDESQTRARGSSAWRGALDNEISVKQTEHGIEISQKKMKDSEEAEAVYMNLKTVAINDWVDDDGEQYYSAIAEQIEGPTGEEKAQAEEVAEREKLGQSLYETTKEEQAFFDFEKVWHWSGCEFVSGLPYVTKSAVKRYSMTVLGRQESYANKLSRISSKKGFLHILFDQGVLEERCHGYVITDGTSAYFLTVGLF